MRDLLPSGPQTTSYLLYDRQVYGFWAACLLLFALPMAFARNEGLVLAINGLHTSWSDVFFQYYTHLGDGLVFLPGLLLFGWKRTRPWGWLLLAVGLGHALLVHVLKESAPYWMPSGALRPKAYIANDALLHFVPGVKVHEYYTFPSGHTASAFALGATLSLWIRRLWVMPLLGVHAMLVGVSRVYLLQHFYEDVYAGALLGVLVALGAYLLLRNRLHARPLSMPFSMN